MGHKNLKKLFSVMLLSCFFLFLVFALPTGLRGNWVDDAVNAVKDALKAALDYFVEKLTALIKSVEDLIKEIRDGFANLKAADVNQNAGARTIADFAGASKVLNENSTTAKSLAESYGRKTIATPGAKPTKQQVQIPGETAAQTRAKISEGLTKASAKIGDLQSAATNILAPRMNSGLDAANSEQQRAYTDWKSGLDRIADDTIKPLQDSLDILKNLLTNLSILWDPIAQAQAQVDSTDSGYHAVWDSLFGKYIDIENKYNDQVTLVRQDILPKMETYVNLSTDILAKMRALRDSPSEESARALQQSINFTINPDGSIPGVTPPSAGQPPAAAAKQAFKPTAGQFQQSAQYRIPPFEKPVPPQVPKPQPPKAVQVFKTVAAELKSAISNPLKFSPEVMAKIKSALDEGFSGKTPVQVNQAKSQILGQLRGEFGKYPTLISAAQKFLDEQAAQRAGQQTIAKPTKIIKR